MTSPPEPPAQAPPGGPAWAADPPPGVQNERTALAWVRACLAYLACVLLAVRLLAARPVPAVLVLAAGSAVAAGLLTGSRRRYRRRDRSLAAGAPVLAPAPVAVLASATALLGLAAAALILLG